jgi:hypothetical protein
MLNEVLKYQIAVYSFLNRHHFFKMIWDNQIAIASVLTAIISKFTM